MGGMSPQNENLDAALFRGRSEKFGTLLQTEDSANLPFVELRAPHRGIFPFTRKDTKGVSKGTPLRYPWGLCPRSNRKRSRAPLCLSRKFGTSLGKSRGGNALSLLEVKEPRGSLCVFGNFLHIRKLPRCGARSSTKRRFAET